MAFSADLPCGAAFACDAEFHKLLTRRPDVDLVAAAMELARDADPAADLRVVSEWLDARAAEVRGPVARAESEAEALAELGRCLNGKHGLTGGCAAFDTSDGSYLHRVIAAGTGLPISLSILYVGVAERVGLELKGVAAPQHFLTRYEAAEGPLFVDAFHGGRVLTEPECRTFLAGLTSLPADLLGPTLEPADARTIVIRMLNNLKALHVRRGEWCPAYHVQHRLVALQPAAYRERRDLATIALNAGRPGQAVDLLEACLRCGPETDRPALREQIKLARTKLCGMN